MRVLSALLGLVVFVAAVNAQDASVKTLRDVKIGMTEKAVVSALSKDYDVDDVKRGETTLLHVIPKAASKQQGESLDGFLERLPSGTIYTNEHKVTGVEVILEPSLTSDDAIRFMKQLFFLLYSQAEVPSPNASQNLLESLGNPRGIDVPMRLTQFHKPEGDSYEIQFDAKGRQFSLSILSPSGRQNAVYLTDISSQPLK
jgi:hypothetical protein